jgi:hypothetical protein
MVSRYPFKEEWKRFFEQIPLWVVVLIVVLLYGRLVMNVLHNKCFLSTRPIYDHFDSMENIEAAVVEKAPKPVVTFIDQDRTGDRWRDQALG